MPFILALIGLCAPRFLTVLLWLFSTWFEGVFETRAWPILGFLFLPFTLLWYSVVVNWFHAEWAWWQVAILILSIIGDLSSGKGATK
jgi:uncharacterized membrane protein